jgi:ankyrin repeat protein
MNKEFEEAIEDNDIEAVKKLLDEKPQLLEETNTFGMTPLMRAVSAMERSVECIKVLIEAGADVNAKTYEGYTPLHCAVDINGPSCRGEMPSQIMRLLVNAGAQLEEQQHWGWTPLMRAVLEGTSDEVRALLAVGANPNKIFPQHTLPEFIRGRSILSAAVLDPEVMKLLIEAGADLNLRDACGQTTLEYAQDVETAQFESEKLECINLLRQS